MPFVGELQPRMRHDASLHFTLPNEAQQSLTSLATFGVLVSLDRAHLETGGLFYIRRRAGSSFGAHRNLLPP